jgi:hypothetical protein
MSIKKVKEIPMRRNTKPVQLALILSLVLSLTLFLASCSSEKMKNQAKESAAHFWQDKAYPGKAFDIQVIEAEKADNGQYRVRGIVDGETRVGTYSPDTETFSEGYYSLAQERNKKIAELEQESKYWKDKAESLDKENYKLKVQLNMTQGKKNAETPNSPTATSP